ncbi:hypothetical protein [Pseudomonas syringae]|uniref:Uncharacterized protein n=1 Tax=Pseudomonas syringae TaxID=317 RepID=A0A085VM38_PSESX|nr:hypothetical protein [Pseudomonas syringae]KFE56501.1 hypothetical protein IV01_09345 [Pseudomonas syringae]
MAQLRCFSDGAVDKSTELDGLLNRCRALHFSIRMVAGLLLLKPAMHSPDDELSLTGFRLQALDDQESHTLVERLASSLNLLTFEIMAIIPQELILSSTQIPLHIGSSGSPFFELSWALHENILAMDVLSTFRGSHFMFSE